MRPKDIFQKRVVTITFIILVAAAYGWARFWKAEPKQTRARARLTHSHVPEHLKVSLVRVVDGDTIEVRYRGRIEPVRLLRINTPERGEPGYQEATRALKSIVDRGYLILVFEDEREARDRHGRLLAYVMSLGMNINVEMVRKGWSRFWTKYGRGRFAAAFESAELEAQKKRVGLWTAEGWRPHPSPRAVSGREGGDPRTPRALDSAP
jgi:micrococcal nuclease